MAKVEEFSTIILLILFAHWGWTLINLLIIWVPFNSFNKGITCGFNIWKNSSIKFSLLKKLIKCWMTLVPWLLEPISKIFGEIVSIIFLIPSSSK